MPMMQRKTAGWISAILALSACNVIVGVEDVEVVPGNGGNGGEAGTGGTGGSPECTQASTCPGMDDACQSRTCVDGVCGIEYQANGQSCGNGKTCDGAGICKGNDGSACTDASACLSGNCVDGVCCATTCTGECSACNVPGSLGTCSPMPLGLDDASADKPCLGIQVFCDGNGKCLGEMGAPCTIDTDCASNLCNAGLCSGKSGTGSAATCGILDPADPLNMKREACHEVRVVPTTLANRLNNPSYPAEVSEFGLDRFEVTVGRFRKFVDAFDTPGTKPAPGAGAHPKIPGSGWNAGWPLAADSTIMRAGLANCDGHFPKSWTPMAGANEDLPADCMTWEEAFAFCAWDGGRLPTETEWNHAAVGGINQRLYPWSDPPNSVTIAYAHAVYDCAGQLPGDITMMGTCALEDMLRVGSKSPLGDSDYGHADIAGSMYEWVRDPFGPPSGFPMPCIDCLVPGQINYVIKGGSWNTGIYQLYNSGRANLIAPTIRHHGVGLRCARDPHPTCGNGIVDAGEYCDDASLDPAVSEGCRKCDKVKKVVAGETHTCAVTELGKLKCWGENNQGQLGQGNTQTINEPSAWPRIPLPPVADVAVSRYRTCALLQDGTVKCFGADNVDGYPGMLGTSMPLTEPQGDEPDEIRLLQAVPLLAPAVQVVSNGYHSCALLNDGTVQCWGANALGELGAGNKKDYQGPATAVFSPGVKATSLTAAYQSTCALLEDGNVACWGLDFWANVGGTDIHGILGLNTNAHYSRGDEAGEMLGANLLTTVLPAAAKPASAISGSAYGYCVMHEPTNAARCWGANDLGQLGVGSLTAWGSNQYMNDMTTLPAIDFGATFVPKQIIAGFTHVCAVSTQGRLKCFGSNDSGELGLGLPPPDFMTDFGVGDSPDDMGDNLAEVNLGMDEVVQVSGGYQFTCALFKNHKVKCWGRNDVGQTGIFPGKVTIGDEMSETVDQLPYVEPF